MDKSSLTRDVVIDGAAKVELPGRISFTVAEPMSGKASSEMVVAVLVPNASGWPGRCEFADDSGSAVESGSVMVGGGYIHPNDTGLEPVQVARLKPGTYGVECVDTGGSEQSTASRFTVGRVIGPSDLTSGELSPLLWFGVVVLISGVVFLVGLIVLVVGLVKRNRWRRGGGPGPRAWGPPGNAGWPPPGYQPPPPGYPGMPQPPYQPPAPDQPYPPQGPPPPRPEYPQPQQPQPEYPEPPAPGEQADGPQEPPAGWSGPFN